MLSIWLRPRLFLRSTKKTLLLLERCVGLIAMGESNTCRSRSAKIYKSDERSDTRARLTKERVEETDISSLQV